MTISPDEIRHLATLARLDLTEDEVGRMAGELTSILAHMEELRRLDEDAGEPAEDATDPGAPLRADREECDPLRRPPAELAPEWADGFFVVPRLPALDARGERESQG